MKYSANLISERRLAVVSALFVALGPMSMALYTPAMPTLVEQFHTTPALIKLTLTAYFAGFAGAQLFCGPLSDGFGRKPVALAFLALYLLGSVLALVAWDVYWLLVARAVQGVGAAAGIAISRAMVRDLFDGARAVRIYTVTAMILAIVPALSPALGALTLQFLGWHAIFGIMVVYGLALIMAIVALIPETHAARDTAVLRPYRLLLGYRSILSDIRFLRAAIVLGLGVGMIYSLATILPFVLMEVAGLTPVRFGFAMMAQSFAYMLGSSIVGRLLARISEPALLRIGFVLIGSGGVMMAVLILLAEPSFLTVMGPIAISTLGLAFVIPFMTALALSPFPHMAGAAGSLTGFFQMGGGFAGSALAAMIGTPTTALAIIMPGMAGLSVVIFLGLSRSVGRKGG